MRFTFVSSMCSHPWGGSEELWSRAAIHLRFLGHEVSALVPFWPQPTPQLQELSRKGVSVRMCQAPNDAIPNRLLRKLRKKLSFLSPEQSWMLKQRPDFVCVSNGNYGDGLNWLEFCANQNLPFATVVQANLEFLWPDDDLAARLIRVYHQTRRAFFVSHRNWRLLETQLGVELQNAEVVRNPFNVSWHADIKWPDEFDTLRLACVARLDPSAKGQDLLFEVLASERWRSRRVVVSIFGKGINENGLKRLASRLQITNMVSFCGHVKNIEQIWSTHHALVLPSRYEGLPLSLVEAMLCARPAIVTDVAGHTELVEDGKSGFVASAATVKHLRIAMDRAWERQSELREMGLFARQRVIEEFPKQPAEIFAEKLINLA